MRIIIEVGLEVEAAKSEFIEQCETFRGPFVLQVGEVDYLKSKQALEADHLMDQRTQKKQYETD